jgi:hypothetical protein
MSETAEHVAELRDQVEAEEKELEAAVHDLRLAARRIGPVEWIREHPLPCLAGALALGWWLGHGRNRRTR